MSSAYRTGISINGRRTVRIEAVEDEGPAVRTFYFLDALCSKAKPGQYVMVWVHGVDEVPMSLSAIDRNGLSGFTVVMVGEATEALYGRRSGDVLGLRGPFGRPFTYPSGPTALIGGGIGAAPLVPLAEELIARGLETTFVLGARTRPELLFLRRLSEAFEGTGSKIMTATDNGSYGFKGDAPSAFQTLLPLKGLERVYVCGPQAMIAKVFSLTEAHGLRVEACLEAYVKCAVGLCGSCCLGPYRVCVDGPVFNEEQLRRIPELGSFRRDASGSKVPLSRPAGRAPKA